MVSAASTALQLLRGVERGVGEGHRPFDGAEGLVDNDRRLYLKLAGRRPPGDQLFEAPGRGTDVVPRRPPLAQEDRRRLPPYVNEKGGLATNSETAASAAALPGAACPASTSGTGPARGQGR